MKNFKSSYFIIILMISFFNSEAQTGSLTRKLDEYLNSANKAYTFNGSVLIAQNGKIILQKGYGYKNVAAKILNDTNSIFQIGSNTKPFTAL